MLKRYERDTYSKSFVRKFTAAASQPEPFKTSQNLQLLLFEQLLSELYSRGIYWALSHLPESESEALKRRILAIEAGLGVCLGSQKLKYFLFVL